MEGKYVSLITYKKNGSPIATQVWFVEEAKKLYVVTLQGRYKFKRIKNNPNVKIAPA
ncbi:MAG: pyridoxamine 5'-phosphate oxidase family protein, partial [Promethearchaeota archaeon]